MKQEAPAAARNRDPIAAVLAQELPASGTVLEIASGTGEHVVHFARIFSHLHWQPSDPLPDARASITAWCEEAGLANIESPLAIDAARDTWPITRCDALLCINMVHISPLAASEGLVRAAGMMLPPGGPMIFYGPWIEADVDTVPSNLDFDASLRSRNAEWGLRDLSWMDELAARHGLQRTRRVAMPANNLMLVYRKN